MEDSIDRFRQICTDSRLKYVTGRTYVKGSIYEINIFMHCQKDDLGSASGISQAPRHLKPSKISQRNVQDNNVRAQCCKPLQHGRAIIHRGRDLIGWLQHLDESFEQSAVIVCEQKRRKDHRVGFHSIQHMHSAWPIHLSRDYSHLGTKSASNNVRLQTRDIHSGTNLCTISFSFISYVLRPAKRLTRLFRACLGICLHKAYAKKRGSKN